MTSPYRPNEQSPYTANAGRPRQYDVEPWRKWAYYGGTALQAIGMLTFFGNFGMIFVSFSHMGLGPGTDSPATQVPRMFAMFPIFIVAMLVMIAGGALRTAGRKGLAGSGLILSPRKEAQDAEAWRRSEGAQKQMELEEMPSLAGGLGAREVVKVRCRGCGYLETEDARFCSGCGAPM